MSPGPSGRHQAPALAEDASDEARLAFLAAISGDALYQLRYDTMTYDYISPGVGRLTGYGPAEINELGFASLVRQVQTPDGSPVDVDHVREMRRRGLTGEVRLDYLVRRRHGDEIWLGDSSFPYYSRGGSLIGSVGVLRDIHDRKLAELENRRLVAELNQALAQVKTLRGLLPICANCKKVRNDQGYWQRIEQYLAEHTEARFSHGLCPQCIEKLYPELERARRGAQTGD